LFFGTTNLRKHTNTHTHTKRKSAGKVGVSAELEPQPVHIMTIKQLVYGADETRPEPHAKVYAGFVSVTLDAAIRSDERRCKHTHMHAVSCLFGCRYNIQNVQTVTSKAILEHVPIYV
jgi:hypothetical protein